MKLYLIVPVKDMNEMLAAKPSCALTFQRAAIFAPSLEHAWEFATWATGRRLKVTPSAIKESQTPKKKQRVAGDMLCSDRPSSKLSSLSSLTLLVENMAALQIERDVSELLGDWKQHAHQKGEHFLAGYSPQSPFFLEATDVICTLQTCKRGPWSPLAASNEAAAADVTDAEIDRRRQAISASYAQYAGTGEWPVERAVAIPAAEAAAAAEEDMQAALLEAAKGPSIFYIAMTEMFLAHVTAEGRHEGCAARHMTLHPPQFASLELLGSLPLQFVPLFQNEDSAVLAVHLHAGSNTNTCAEWTWPHQWNIPRAGVCEGYALLKISVQQTQMEEFLRNGHMQLAPRSNCVELRTALHLTGAGVSAERVQVSMTVEIKETKILQQIWVEQLQRDLLSLQEQSEIIKQQIEQSGYANWKPLDRFLAGVNDCNVQRDVPCDL